MKDTFTLHCEQSPVALRTILPTDCENLRRWKNANRFSFFFQELITPQMQADWFRKYLERDDDWMFAVEYQGQPVGCMGFRLLESHADIYNVILGETEYGGQGLMGRALRIMCSYIWSNWTQDIQLKVLKTNPAVTWYKRNEFYEISARDNFFELKLASGVFQPCNYQRRSIQAT